MFFPFWVGEQRSSNEVISVSSLAMSRVQKELSRSMSEGIPGIGLSIHGDGSDLSHLTGTITGPVGTPYEGGTFEIDIWVPRGYPIYPPTLKFRTKIWHPNISSRNGVTCRQGLRGSWGPALTLEKLLLCIQAMLSGPEPEFPVDTEATEQYLYDYPAYVSKARYWTEAFAKPESPWMKEKVSNFVQMGFPEGVAEYVLAMVDYDENKALTMLAGAKPPYWGLQPGSSSIVSLFTCQ